MSGSDKADKEAAKAEAKANKERAKVQKYRAAFLDPTSNLAPRQKAFLNYCEYESDAAVGPTFRDNHILVLSTLQDTVNTVDVNAKKGLFPRFSLSLFFFVSFNNSHMHTHAMHCIATGKHMKEEECKNLANVIRKVILHLPDDLKDVRNARFVCLLFSFLCLITT